MTLIRRKLASRASLLSTIILSAVMAACSSNSATESDSDNNTENTIFAVELNGSQQVPVANTAATATGSLTLSNDTGALSGSLQSTGMAITVAHIHESEAGRNGGIVVTLSVENDLVSVPDNTVLTADQIAQLLDGRYYINLHSERFPGGEIRGQITPEGIEVFSLALNGDSEIPPLVSNGSGTGYITLRDDAESISVAIVSNTDSSATAAHLHAGFAGENGGVILGLEASASEVGRFEGSTELSTEDYQQVRQGGTYLNLHTQANPGGELRGQLLPKNIRIFSAALTGNQEVPPVQTNASGAGYLTLNTTTNSLTAIINTQALNGASMAHLHAGAIGANGDVIVGLVENTDDSAVWAVRNATISVAEQALIEAGNTYFNVHTAAYPGGELRGQLTQGQYASVPEYRVRNGSAEFVRVFANNSGAELAPFYTENATLTLPGQATVTGRDAISNAWQGAFTQGGLRVVRLSIDSIETGTAPEQYVERGQYSLDIETGNGLTTLESNYVVTWLVPANGSKALILDDQINP